MNKWITGIAIMLLVLSGKAQETPHYLSARVIDGDTVPQVQLPVQNVLSPRKFKSKRAKARYNRLQRRVIKVYPYAKLAGQKLEEYAKQLEEVEDKRERKVFYKEIENSLREEYEGELRKLTISEGRILIKLIDRETGNSSYSLVKDLRGSFSAFFWQSLARIFGQNLKEEYDPKGKDKEIEYIVMQIEAGYLPLNR